jgi:hypothetical protein
MEGSVIASVDALRRVASRLRAGELGEDGLWLADRLFRYFDEAPSGLTIGRALGLERDRGHQSWWAIERRARTNESLRECARKFLANENSLWACACVLKTLVRQYESGQWLRDRNLAEMPASYRDTPREFLFRACRANAEDGQRAMPTSAKHFESILNHCEDDGNINAVFISKLAMAKCSRDSEVANVDPKEVSPPVERREQGGRRRRLARG